MVVTRNGYKEPKTLNHGRVSSGLPLKITLMSRVMQLIVVCKHYKKLCLLKWKHSNAYVDKCVTNFEKQIFRELGIRDLSWQVFGLLFVPQSHYLHRNLVPTIDSLFAFHHSARRIITVAESTGGGSDAVAFELQPKIGLLLSSS